jgi:very-short-patch-repair endonuclease
VRGKSESIAILRESLNGHVTSACVEIDGPHHGRLRDRTADARQDRALTVAGYETLRFTDEDVYRRPDRIQAALAARYPRLTVRTPAH